MKYIEILNQTAEQAASQNNQLIAEEAELNLQSELFRVKKNLAEKANYLNTLKRQKPLSFNTIVNVMNDIKLLERHQSQLIELQKELF